MIKFFLFQVLSDIGVILGSDMTSEAAYTKLCYVLSKDEWDHETKKEVYSILISCQGDYLQTECQSTVVQLMGAKVY